MSVRVYFQFLEYTLNTVNSYGDNLLHITAANGCLDITREILQKQDCCKIIDRKNEFGWSPLMLAIRNRDVRTVKYLLEKESNVNESTYLGKDTNILIKQNIINEQLFASIKFNFNPENKTQNLHCRYVSPWTSCCGK